jgi:hypothetical protein
MTAAGLVLLIACLDVADLLLARAAAARQREIARGPLVGSGQGTPHTPVTHGERTWWPRQGGLFGIGVAFLASKVLIRMVGSGPDTIGVHFQLNFEVLAFTTAVSVLTVLLFGPAPAYGATRISVAPTVKEAGRARFWAH